MQPVKVKCHNCGYIIEITSKKRPLKVKCPECKEIGILRAPLPKLPKPKPEIKEMREKKEVEPRPEIKEKVAEKKAEKLTSVPGPKVAPRSIRSKVRNFLRARISKPIVIILVIAIILTSIQLSSLISTGETIIIPSDFGVPQEFEDIKKKWGESNSTVKEKAEGLLDEPNWTGEVTQPKEISYDVGEISKSKPEWTRIFGDIENSTLVLQPDSRSWAHTTTNDFEDNCSLKEGVEIADDMVKLQTSALQGMFVSKPLDSQTDNAVLKNVDWHSNTSTGSEIVIIVEVSYFQDRWVPVWSSKTLPGWAGFLEVSEIAKEVISGRYFRYLVGFYDGLLKPQLEDITISVTTATLDRKYYVFTYYQSDTPQVDGDGVAGGNFTQLGFTIPEYNCIDVDPGSEDGNDTRVSLRLKGKLSDRETNPLQPPTYLTGGLEIELEKKNDKALLTIYFVKPINYENKTYLEILGFYFSDLPKTFSFTAISKNIIVQATAFAMGGATPIDVQPPYKITWSMDKQIPELGLFIGYAEYGPVKAIHLFEARFTPGIGNGKLYYEEVPPKASLTWQGSAKTNLSAYYKEENLYTEFKLEKLPLQVSVIIESKDSISKLNYSSSSELAMFCYRVYEFDANLITELNISGIPSSFMVESSFKIPPKEEPEPDPSDSFIGRALNYVITRIDVAMQRVRKALKSISDTLYSPDNILKLKSTLPITTIEVKVLKSVTEIDIIQANYLQLTGNYIGILNNSLQASLRNVRELTLSFGRNITFILERNGDSGPFTAICSYGATEILVNISELPRRTSITGNVENISCMFSDPVGIALASETQNYNLEASLKKVSKMSKNSCNFSIEFAPKGNIELALAKSKEQFYKMNENYIYANISQPAISLKLESLRSLEFGMRFSIALAKEYPLKLLFGSNITAGKILIKNLPADFNISLSRALVRLPKLEELSFSKLPTVLSSFGSALGEAVNTLSELPDKLFLKENLTLSYASYKAPIIAANFSRGKNELPWTHGIALTKSKTALDGKLYLELPKNATFSFKIEKGFELRYRVESRQSSLNWVTARLERERTKLFAHLQNITEAKTGVIKIVKEKPPGIGVNATIPDILKKANLTIDLFIANTPQDFNLTFTRKPNLSLVWNASSRIHSIYLNLTSESGGKSYRSYFIARDLPQNFNFVISRAPQVSARTFAIHETLPKLEINASTKFDFYLKLAGKVIGRKSDFMLYGEGLKELSVKSEHNAVIISGEPDKLFFRITGARVGEFKLDKLEFLVIKLTKIRLATNQVFGKFPILELTCRVKELQLNFNFQTNTPIGKLDKLMLANFGFFSLNTRKNSLRITDTATHYVFIAPVLSLF